MSHHFIGLNQVSFSYPDGTVAIRDISFNVLHGESVGIVGPNGAGKSTLLMLLNGYLLPASGAIVIGDLQLDKGTRKEIRKRVGLVFQDPDDQLFMPRVYDDIAFGLMNLRLSPERVEEKVIEALRTVGSLHLKDRAPHHLSSGQKSLIAIAAVLAMGPDILVMDEPASNLDPKARRGLINLLKGFEHTKIIASHDLDLILDVCSRCIVIRDGMVQADGNTFSILSDQSLMEENGLELPLSMQRR